MDNMDGKGIDKNFKKKINKIRIDLRMNPDLLRRLDDFCNETGFYRTSVIERAILGYYNKVVTYEYSSYKNKKVKKYNINFERHNKKSGDKEKVRVDIKMDPFIYTKLIELQESKIDILRNKYVFKYTKTDIIEEAVHIYLNEENIEKNKRKIKEVYDTVNKEKEE